MSALTTFIQCHLVDINPLHFNLTGHVVKDLTNLYGSLVSKAFFRSRVGLEKDTPALSKSPIENNFPPSQFFNFSF